MAKYAIQRMDDTRHKFSPEDFVAALELEEREKMKEDVDRAMEWLTSLKGLL